MPQDQKVKVRIQASDEASAQLTKVQGTFGKFSSFLASRFVVTLGDMTRAVKAVGGAIRESLDLSAQERVLRTQLASMGQSYDDFISKAKEAANQTLSTADIIKNATRAKLLGVGFEEMIDLLEIARVSALATGDSLGKAFEDITIGVARQSKMILDNLGFVIDLNGAYETMAKELGKNRDALTETERKQALLNEVMRQGKTRIEELGDAAGGLKEKLDQAEAGITDLTNEFKDLIRNFAQGASASIEAGEGIASVTKRLEELEPVAKGAGAIYAAFLGHLAESFSVSKAVIATLQDLPDILKDIGKSAEDAAASAGKLAPKIEETGEAASNAAADMKKLEDALKAEAEAYDRAVESASAFGAVTSIQLSEQIWEITIALESQKMLLGENSREYQKLAEIAEAKITMLKERIQSLKDGYGDLTTATKKANEAITSYANDMDAATSATERNTNAITTHVGALNAQAEASRFIGFSSFGGQVTSYYAAARGRNGQIISGGRMFNPEKRSYVTPDGGIIFI